MAAKFMRCITCDNGRVYYLPKPFIPTGAGNLTDSTNIGQIETDISEFGSVLGKIFRFYSIPGLLRLNPAMRRIFGYLWNVLQNAC